MEGATDVLPVGTTEGTLSRVDSPRVPPGAGRGEDVTYIVYEVVHCTQRYKEV